MDPYYWENNSAIYMWLMDQEDAETRRTGRANVFADNSAQDLDPCYSDEIIPTRPRNRMRQMVRSLT